MHPWLQWLPPGWREGEESDDEANMRRRLLGNYNASNTTANATLTDSSDKGGKDRGGLLVGNLFYCTMAMLATILFHLLIRLGFHLRHNEIPMVMHFPQVRQTPLQIHGAWLSPRHSTQECARISYGCLLTSHELDLPHSIFLG